MSSLVLSFCTGEVGLATQAIVQHEARCQSGCIFKSVPFTDVCNVANLPGAIKMPFELAHIWFLVSPRTSSCLLATSGSFFRQLLLFLLLALLLGCLLLPHRSANTPSAERVLSLYLSSFPSLLFLFTFFIPYVHLFFN